MNWSYRQFVKQAPPASLRNLEAVALMFQKTFLLLISFGQFLALNSRKPLHQLGNTEMFCFTFHNFKDNNTFTELNYNPPGIGNGFCKILPNVHNVWSIYKMYSYQTLTSDSEHFRAFGKMKYILRLKDVANRAAAIEYFGKRVFCRKFCDLWSNQMKTYSTFAVCRNFLSTRDSKTTPSLISAPVL